MTDAAYARPETLSQALTFLRDYGEQTQALAGGTDLMVDLRAGKLNTPYLLDVSRLSELKGIDLSHEGLYIGAGVTISELYHSPLIAEHAPALVKACAWFGSPQVRNAATIGGNVANASPSADTVPPLLVHDAVAVLAGPDGERQAPVAELFKGPYQSAVEKNELITRFLLKPAEGRFSDFQKIGRRKAMAISRLSMAVMADRASDGILRSVELALGSGTPIPMRMKRAESFLMKKRPTQGVLEEGAFVLAEEMIAITGRRPSTVYKEKAVQGLFLRLMNPLLKVDSEKK